MPSELSPPDNPNRIDLCSRSYSASNQGPSIIVWCDDAEISHQHNHEGSAETSNRTEVKIRMTGAGVADYMLPLLLLQSCQDIVVTGLEKQNSLQLLIKRCLGCSYDHRKSCDGC